MADPKKKKTSKPVAGKVKPAARKEMPATKTAKPAIKTAKATTGTAKDAAGIAKDTTRRARSSTGSAKSATKTATHAPRNVKDKLSILKPSGAKDDSFFDLVHEVARQIPRGRVTSYGAIAACLGTRLSARMVGWAMMAVPSAKRPVPAHRVVNRNGLLTGKHHYNPPERMQQLLEKEGVTIKDDKVVDFKKRFWDPAQEL